jgi:hypothetical protein
VPEEQQTFHNCEQYLKLAQTESLPWERPAEAADVANMREIVVTMTMTNNTLAEYYSKSQLGLVSNLLEATAAPLHDLSNARFGQYTSHFEGWMLKEMGLKLDNLGQHGNGEDRFFAKATGLKAPGDGAGDQAPRRFTQDDLYYGHVERLRS